MHELRIQQVRVGLQESRTSIGSDNGFTPRVQGMPPLRTGTRALFIVVLATALVMTPLILGGALLGFYVGDSTGYPKDILAIAFSTVGFVAGMLIIFRVIRAVVSGVGTPSR